MCGRFSLFQPQPEIERRFGSTATERLGQRYNIAPPADVPVIRADAPEEINLVEWGFVAPWDDSKRLINARAESVAEKQTFREAFEKRRCLVIADGYYEWQDRPKGPKQPYRIQRADGAAFAFAGLWNPSNGYEKPTCTIVTTGPSASIESIHDRMPAMLEPDDEDDWLVETDRDELLAILDPYPDSLLDAYEISTAVNNPENDSPDLIEPVGGEQSGLGEFSS